MAKGGANTGWMLLGTQTLVDILTITKDLMHGGTGITSSGLLITTNHIIRL